MNLYPAIDLINGRCVRLAQGDFNRVSHYTPSPLDVADDYARRGAKYMHVVDLDGARAGSPQQGELIGEMVKRSSLCVQTGGGIREVGQAAALIEKGIQRVVIGSLAVKKPEAAKEILKVITPAHFTLAMDVRLNTEGQPMVATEGWKKEETLSLWDCLDDYITLGLQHLLCTDIGRDGMLTGPNVKLYSEIIERYPHLQLQASGGVGELAHLTALKVAGIPGAIVGKALYENRFTLEEALKC